MKLDGVDWAWESIGDMFGEMKLRLANELLL